MAETFGGVVRQRRQEKGISLRRFAEMIGISPTYMSKIERDEFDPPPEARVRAIARALDLDADDLLGLAHRVPKDLQDIIQKHPKAVAILLRSTDGLGPEQIERLAETARTIVKPAGWSASKKKPEG